MRKAMNYIGFLAWAISLVMTIIYFPQLPNEVPSHYDFRGEADSWANKWFIFFIPTISIGLWLLMGQLEKYPQFINMPGFKVDSASPRQIANMKEMAYVMRFAIVLFLSWMTIQVVLQAVDGRNDLGIWGFVLFISILIVTIFYYGLKNKKLAALE